MSNTKANGLLSIPATSRKMVQSLKEIVNCPEHEIYAMLKECNMDPNDTVNRLLSQGSPFFLFYFSAPILCSLARVSCLTFLKLLVWLRKNPRFGIGCVLLLSRVFSMNDGFWLRFLGFLDE